MADPYGGDIRGGDGGLQLSGGNKGGRAGRTVPLYGGRVDKIGSAHVERKARASRDCRAGSQLRNGWWGRSNGEGGASGNASTGSRIGNGEERRADDSDISGGYSCLQLGTGNKGRGARASVPQNGRCGDEISSGQI